MLKINKKLKIPLLLIMISCGGIFLYQYLTFIPEYSSATTTIETTTPVTITPTTPLAKWEDLEYMQQMTPQACVSARENDSKKLIDNRDTSKSYTVTKLKGNAGCWMTENMAYNGGLRMYPTNDKDLNEYGGYYDSDSAKKVCNFTGWQLPTQAQYKTLLSAHSIGDNAAGSAILRNPPLNFLYGGEYSDGLFRDTDRYGNYWSSTRDGSGTDYLFFYSTGANLYSRSSFTGYSVRCVAKTSSTVTPVDPSAGGSTGINDPNISVTIPKVLTLDVTDSVNIETSPNNISTGTFTASVTSNANYSISLNATSEDASATSLVNIKDNKKVAEIPTITSATQPTIGISSWGIRKCNNLTTETCTENYKPLPTKNSTTGNPFLTSTPGNHQHLFQIGIGIGPELPSGTYTTSITVTASQN